MALQKCGLNLDQRARELKPHGTAAFPCAAYQDRYGEGEKQAVSWHWHEELEVARVKSGVMSLQIPGKRLTLGEGDLVVINSGVLHSAVPEPKCELQSLVFHGDLVAGGKNSVFSERYLSPLMKTDVFRACVLKKQEQQEANGWFLQAFEAMAHEQAGFEFHVREELSRLCFFLYQQYEETMERENAGGQGRDSLRIREMLEYIHSNFSEELSLADIAGAADIGARECLRCFQRTLQVSPKQYLLRYRVMEGARILAAEPWRSIGETAALCGFDSPGSFSMMFKRFYKCTPREYRKTISEEMSAKNGQKKEEIG